jgi:tRNA G18 (ribose-2'-O)-methylase SpoU
MARRRARLDKEARRLQMLQRYEKQRVRNQLAAPGRHPYALVLDGLKAGYNVAKIFRSALAMGAAEIHLVDIGPFDPAPAKGAFRKVPARFHDDFASAFTDLERRDFSLFALNPGARRSLPDQVLPTRSAFVFGHEEHGLSFDPADYPALGQLAIPQSGEIESLNVSIAASIVMYEYLRQHGI